MPPYCLDVKIHLTDNLNQLAFGKIHQKKIYSANGIQDFYFNLAPARNVLLYFGELDYLKL